MFLFAPVIERYWKQHELWDGTYTLDDLLDIHEAMWIKNYNTNLVMEYERSLIGKEG